MGNSWDDNKKQYLHNKKFIGKIDSEFDDWAVTVTFYAAIHLIEAVLSKKCNVTSVHNHDDRKRSMYENKEVFSECMTDYLMLQSLARTARYSGIARMGDKDALEAQTELENLEFQLKKYIE